MGVPQLDIRSNESLERVGGHIGYVVVPGFQRQGYATAKLWYVCGADSRTSAMAIAFS